MNIPEEAIEAAAKALASDSTAGLIGRDDPNLEWKTWAGNARSALQAALPYLEAALRKQIANDIRAAAITLTSGSIAEVARSVQRQAARIAEEGNTK